MKKLLLFFLLLLGAVFADAAELDALRFPDAESIKAVDLWLSGGCKAALSHSTNAPAGAKGSLCFTMEQPGPSPLSAQLSFARKVTIVTGVEYTMTLRVMSPQNLNFEARMIQNYPPFAHISPALYVTTEPGKWKTVKLSFKANGDFNPLIRIPSFGIGHLPAGSKLYVADMTFEGPAKPPMPTYSISNEFSVDNLAAKKDWSYAKAWKLDSPCRTLLSLCGMWDFALIDTPDTALTAVAPEQWANFVVPGHWRGGNVTNFIHTSDGRTVTRFKGTPVREVLQAWYKRTIDIPADWQGRKMQLIFNHISVEGDIYVNGKRVGGKESFIPYPTYVRSESTNSCILDVTNVIQPGKTNEIAVRVTSPGDADVQRSGIMGTVYLDSFPAENFGTPSLTTRVSRNELDIEFIDTVAKSGELSVTITDWKTGDTVHQTTVPFAQKVTLPFKAPKLWSPEAPNLYWVDLKLEKNGTVIDTHRVRTGFAELTVNGPDYMLNGRKINLFADTGLNTGGYWTPSWKNSPDFVRRELRVMRTMNINSTYFGPLMPPELLDLYDEEGILVFPVIATTYDNHLELSDKELLKLYQDTINHWKKFKKHYNHPALTGFIFDIWFNFHAGTTNPEYVGLSSKVKKYPAFSKDGSIITRKGPDPNLSGERYKRKLRLDKVTSLLRKELPGKLLLTGASGDAGDAFSGHAYHTWGAPFEEMRALFARYALQREIPIFIGEYNVPYPYSMHILTDATPSAESVATENMARYSGNDSYRYRTFYVQRPLQDTGSASLISSRTDSDEEGQYHLKSDLYNTLLVRSLRTMIPGWRYSGANGISFFSYILGYSLALSGHTKVGPLALPDDLSAPYNHAEYTPWGAWTPAVGPEGTAHILKPSLATAATRRVTAPVLAEFMEQGKDAYGLDHAWFSGDILRKKLVVINDTPVEQTFTVDISLRGENNEILVSRRDNCTVAQGAKAELPVDCKVPASASRFNGRLMARVTDSSGKQVAAADLAIEIFPKLAPLSTSVPLYLCDPEGSIRKYFDANNVSYKALEGLRNLPRSGVLIVGRKALGMAGSVPDFNKLTENGLNVLIMEQLAGAAPELMQTRTRYAFINAAGHPALAGFQDRDFANWRGGVSLGDSYIINPAGHGWSGFGNRNMVADYVFRRPSHGNYLSLLCSGFDMFQTPLLEYRTRNASWIASQLEMAPRLGVDPAATTLFHRLVTYLANRGKMQGETLFFGGEKGEAFLQKFRAVYRKTDNLDADTLASAGTLIISDPDFKKLRSHALELEEFVYNGGKILYLHTGDKFESVWLPFPLKIASATGRSALRNTGKADNFWLCGWENNELYWNKEHTIPVFRDIPEHANAYDPGVAMDLPHGAGRFTLVSIIPDLFGDSPATGKASRFLSALMTNAGIRLENNSVVFRQQNSEKEQSIDLEKFDWSFALDPQNCGMEEGVHLGKKGSLVWQTGLIADGAEVKIGMMFEQFLRKDYDGFVWYKLTFDMPSSMLQCEKLYLCFGAIDDLDWTYINGKEVGKTGKETPSWWMAPRIYEIPKGLLKVRGNELIVRVHDTGGGGGIVTMPAVISNKIVLSSALNRAWQTPYPEGTRREYEYRSDIVRQY